MNNTGHLTVETFKNIFEKLKLGTIASSDVDIFKEVADFDGDGVISLEDFRKILTYTPGEAEDLRVVQVFLAWPEWPSLPRRSTASQLAVCG